MLETPRTWFFLRRLRAGLHRSPESLKGLQDRLLRFAVAHAYEKIPFYRRFWNEAGFDALKFRGIKDLERIPITTSDMVKEAANREELLVKGVDRARCTYLDSSGSSGTPLRIWKQPLEERVRRAVGLSIWFEHGFHWRYVTAQFQILSGPSHPLQRFGISTKTWISTELPIEEQLVQFIGAKADVVVGTPTALRRIAEAIETFRERPKEPRIVFAAGELLDDETSEVIKKVFGVKPVGVYGQTEVGYLAWQCERRNNFHLNADTHLVEVIKDSRPADPGELGRIVVSDLYAKTMPFLRYDTTDLAIAASDGCPCGRKLPVITSIEGRAHGSLCLRDGRILTTRRIVNHMADILPLGEYRLYQETIDRVRIELTPSTSGKSGFAEINMQGGNLEAVVLKRLRQLMGGVEFSVKTVAPWQHDGSGKTHTVFSKVPIPGLSAR